MQRSFRTTGLVSPGDARRTRLMVFWVTSLKRQHVSRIVSTRQEVTARNAAVIFGSHRHALDQKCESVSRDEPVRGTRDFPIHARCDRIAATVEDLGRSTMLVR